MIALPTRNTVVTVTGTLKDGSEVAQKFPIRHTDEVDDARIFGQVLEIINNSGGLVTNVGQRKLRFHPLASFLYIEMSADSVVLASSVDGLQ